MEIRVKRTQELTKSILGGSNVRLGLEIVAILSDAEKQLLQKYGDRTLNFVDLRSDATKDLTWSSLGNFKATVHVADGLRFLGAAQSVEASIIAGVTKELNYLKTLECWSGEESIDV